MAVYLRVRLRRTRFREARVARLAETILAAAGESASELSIELVGDRRMRRLNRQYRRKDRTTDVLAFPMREASLPSVLRSTTENLGDVVISVPTALRQARDAGRTPDDELTILLVHGVLHLCGYDHERGEKEAARMHRRERAILRVVRPVPELVIHGGEAKKGSH